MEKELQRLLIKNGYEKVNRYGPNCYRLSFEDEGSIEVIKVGSNYIIREDDNIGYDDVEINYEILSSEKEVIEYLQDETNFEE